MELVDVVFVTNYCKPHTDPDGKQSSIVYKAGQKYKVPMNEEMKMLLERKNIYKAGQPAPAEPPVMDPPISSSRAASEQNMVSEIIKETVAAVLELPTEQQAAMRKKGWGRPQESK